MRLTDFLAIYAASLSTTIALWNYFRSRPQLRVLIVIAMETVEGELQSGLGISIQNISSQTVHITNVSFLYPYRRSTIPEKIKHVISFKRIPRNDGWCHSSLSLNGINDECPTSVEPGKSHWIFVRHEVVERLLAKAESPHFKAVVQDALWRNRYSKVFGYARHQKQEAQAVAAT